MEMSRGNSLAFQNLVSIINHFAVAAKETKGQRINRMFFEVFGNPAMEIAPFIARRAQYMPILFVICLFISFTNISDTMQYLIIKLRITGYKTMKRRDACSAGDKKKFIMLNLMTVNDKVSKGTLNLKFIARFEPF